MGISIRGSRWLTACLFLLVFPWTEESAQAGEALRIMVSLPPQKEVVERIAGPDAEITVLLPPGKSPETYSPAPSQIRQLAEADVYFSIGVPFEKMLLRNVSETHPNLVVADLSRGIARRWLEERHDHGEAGESVQDDPHAGGEPDPHVWLAPLLLAHMGEQAAVTLFARDPNRSPDYQRAAVAFRQEMEDLDAELKAMLAPFSGRTVFVYHPAFGYFTDAYGLKQEAIEQGGSSPTPRQMARLIASARADDVRVIFVQPEFDQKKAGLIAEAIEGRVVSLNPLEEQVTENLRRIGVSIQEALQ